MQGFLEDGGVYRIPCWNWVTGHPLSLLACALQATRFLLGALIEFLGYALDVSKALASLAAVVGHGLL
eukprot:13972043-Alexandrium_andersonii.AAC.1